MKKLLFALLFGFAVIAAAQDAAQQKKVIQDPAEFKAFDTAYKMSATNAAEINAKIQAYEAFLVAYPKTVAREDAIAFLAPAYQSVGNVDKFDSTSAELLKFEPNNLEALVRVAFVDRALGLQALVAKEDDPAGLKRIADGAVISQHGLDVIAKGKPAGLTLDDAAWTKQAALLKTIFTSVVSANDFYSKNYVAAQSSLADAVKLLAGDPLQQQYIYLLGRSYLAVKPATVDSIFGAAHAISLSSNDGIKDYLTKVLKTRYHNFHGGEDGFTDVLAKAAASETKPADFSIVPAPTPAEQVADMLKKTPDATKLGAGDWEFILVNGAKDAVDTTWAAIKGKGFKMQGWVASASASEFKIYATPDAQEAKTADLVLTVAEPIKESRLPKEGALITFTGVVDSYDFDGKVFLLHIKDGDVVEGLGSDKKAAPKAAPAHRRK